MELILKDKSRFLGTSFGAELSLAGEVVFNTGMTGYVESLSDPSYANQILVLTYPLVGNYGVPDASFFESKRIHLAGLVVSEYSETYSHRIARQSLAEWLKKEKIPAISGVDTRALTKKLREKGTMLGALLSDGQMIPWYNPDSENQVARVSPMEVSVHGSGLAMVVVVDCGAKENIIRLIQKPGLRVLRVPWNYDFTKEAYDGVIISNGPGDPTHCQETIAIIKKVFAQKKPMLGICLGVQLMALASGAKTYKLKYGHRSHNQPCRDLINGQRCYITSQNHGFAVEAKTLGQDWRLWFENANDGSVEGIRHKTLPFWGVQFHPEASPGPTDTRWIIDDFISKVLAGLSIW
ncbi:glutamine-hydrolyzing carbamoyl-phosphate synthase small subunit [Candidatus Azambacteria bacterium]|nr:glutamine-hydrolyzing carbamoyl-phosphate synthase small subunit [Candidatus Azambacteria bacterium]